MNDRRNSQAILIKELLVYQGLREVGAPKDKHVSVALSLQCRHILCHVAPHHRRIVPARGLDGTASPFTAASILATSILPIVIIASNARLATSPPWASASVSTRGVICHEQAPAPVTLACRAAVADDRVPVFVGLGLVVDRYLERERLAVLELGPPFRPMHGTPHTVKSTVSTSPALPEG
jgi:hypothetical protein